jgi:hypothetical protein
LLAVVISEIAVSDSTGGDWVELHNNGGVSANISGWKISDAANSFSIPANTHLTPHEFRRFVVQPPVNLSRNGPYDNQDTVTLRTSSNVIVDGPIAYPEQVNDSSWGIVPGTESNMPPTYRYFETPTPDARNGYLLSATPSGIYNSAFTPSLAAILPNGGDKIHYTLDGSKPSLSHGINYATNPPGQISATTTLRYAIIVGGEVRESGLRSYLLEDQLVSDVDAANGGGTLSATEESDLRAAMNSLPALLITVVDAAGFQPVPANFGGDASPAISTVELIEGGVSKFQHTSEVKGHGNTCDQFDTPKPCLRLTFKKVANDLDDPSRSGIKELPFDLFPVTSFPAPTTQGNDRTIDEIVLRAGNQDGLYRNTTEQGTYVRDLFARDKFREMGGVTPHQRPVNVFVNGKYEGLYFASERITGHYLASNFGGDNENYYLVRGVQGQTGPQPGPNGHANSVAIWNSFFDQTVSTNLTIAGGTLTTQPGFYTAVNGQVDLDNFIDFILVNQLTKHSEFYLGFNWFASRKTAEGEKWQFHLWDIENWEVSNTDVVAALAPSDLDGTGKVVATKRHPFYLHSLLMKTAAYKAQVEARLLEILPVGPVGQPNPFSLAGIVQPIEAALDELDTAIRGEIVRYPHATHSNWTVDKGELRENVPYRNRGELIFDYAVILDAMLLTDYLPDGRLDFEDINAFAAAIRSQSAPVSTHDLNDDQQVDVHDLIVLVNFYLGTFIGDADLDGLFNSADFVFVLTAGKYENGETFDWREGDWNGDGVFDSNDILFAFQGGGYDPS